MAIFAICPACRHQNPVGRLFCMQCGASMSAAKAEQSREGSIFVSFFRFLFQTIRLLIALALTGVIGLMLWPVIPGGLKGDVRDAQRLTQKMEILRRANLENKASTQRISELEVNAHLHRLIDQSTRPDASGLEYRILDLNTVINPDDVVVTMLSSFGPVKLSYEVTGIPLIESRNFTFQIRSARLGHLTMPGPLAGWLAGRVGHVLSRQDRDRDVLDKLDQMTLSQGEATLTMQQR